MSDANLIGDTKELTDQATIVPVVHEIKGKNSHFYVKLKDDISIKHYLASYASVQIAGPLKFELSAPVTSSVAATAVIAVVPDKYHDFPTTSLQVRRLEGSITLKDAILVPSSLHFEGKVREVATSLQPSTLIDYPPVVVGHLQVAGGAESTITTFTILVPLKVSGVAHYKTW